MIRAVVLTAVAVCYPQMKGGKKKEKQGKVTLRVPKYVHSSGTIGRIQLDRQSQQQVWIMAFRDAYLGAIAASLLHFRGILLEFSNELKLETAVTTRRALKIRNIKTISKFGFKHTII